MERSARTVPEGVGDPRATAVDAGAEVGVWRTGVIARIVGLRRVLRGAVPTAPGNLLILLGEFHALASNQIHQHESHGRRIPSVKPYARAGRAENSHNRANRRAITSNARSGRSRWQARSAALKRCTVISSAGTSWRG